MNKYDFKLKLFGVSVTYSGDNWFYWLCTVLLAVITIVVLMPMALVMAVSCLVHAPFEFTWASWASAFFLLVVFTKEVE